MMNYKLVVLLILSLIPALKVSDSPVHAPENTLILRVRSVDPASPVRFSGTYQFDSNGAPVRLNQMTPFGVKMKAGELKASISKQQGESEIVVEVIEFINDVEKSSVSKTGNTFEVTALSSDDKHFMTVR